jgi:hypothetical protein
MNEIRSGSVEFSCEGIDFDLMERVLERVQVALLEIGIGDAMVAEGKRDNSFPALSGYYQCTFDGCDNRAPFKSSVVPPNWMVWNGQAFCHEHWPTEAA